MASESDISSLLINQCKTEGVNRDTETKLAKEILGVVYSDFKFNDNMLPETLLTLTMNQATHTAILDMMKTRQCYSNWESEQSNFFDKRRLLDKENSQSGSGTLVGRKVDFVSPATTPGAGRPTFRPSEVPGVKVDNRTLDEVALLQSHTGYFFEGKDNVTYAYRLPNDVPNCQAMHSKYWLLVAALKHLNLSRPEVPRPVPDSVRRAVKRLLDAQNPAQEIARLLNSPPQDTNLIDYWHWTYRLLQARENPTSQQLFYLLIHLSDQWIQPIVPCFIDALTHAQQLLPPLHDEEGYYAQALQDPPMVVPETRVETPVQTPVQTPAETGVPKPVPVPQASGSGADDSAYMPSDMARDDPPTRWSEVLRDLFKVNTKVAPRHKARHH